MPVVAAGCCNAAPVYISEVATGTLACSFSLQYGVMCLTGVPLFSLCPQHQGDAAAAAAALDAAIRPQVGEALKLLAAADEQQEVRDNASYL
jgi:hypothetical protein